MKNKKSAAASAAAAAAAADSNCRCSSSPSSSVITKTTKCNEETRKAAHKRPKPNAANAHSPHDSASSAKPRSSKFRGVTRHRWTGRFEAHLWDKNAWNAISNKKGRQIYLGAYENEEDAARTYDLAAIKYWGTAATINFPMESYDKETVEMLRMSKEEYLASLRRQSSGFSRGVSKYRGVARHHHNGRWEARIGRVAGNKYLYLGTFSTQEEAAAAYDVAAIEFRGPNAVTNFHISNYADKLKELYPELEAKHEGVEREKNINPKPVDPQPEEAHNLQQDVLSWNPILTKDSCGSGGSSYRRTRNGELPKNHVVLPIIPKLESMEQSNASTRDYARNQQQGGNHVILPIIPKTESIIESNDSPPMILLDPIEEHGHPWDLCLDIDINMAPLPDVPLDQSLDKLGWIDDKGFEDNIECIFDDGLQVEGKPAHDEMSGMGGCKAEPHVLGSEDMNKQGLSTSTSSSSLSTMASVGSNM